MKKEKNLSLAENSFYNTVGSIVYCFCQWLVSSVFVVHFSPEATLVSNTGMLQLAMSVTNIFFSVSMYSMRTYQISDTENRYSDREYIGVRIVTCLIAFFLCTLYAVACGYGINGIACIAFYMIYKLSEAFCDVLHGIDQKNYRMDYVGISFILRGAVTVAVFPTVLYFTENLFVAITAMAVANFAVVAIYDMRATSSFCSVKPKFDGRVILSVLITCFPAMVASSAFTAITTVPRQLLENMHGEEALGYYGTMATPVVIIQVLATSIFNPMLNDLTELYVKKDNSAFLKKLGKSFLLLLAIVAVCVAGIALLGEFAVKLVFGERFAEYTYLMYGMVGCTAVYVVSWMCSNILIIARKLKVCMVASLCGLALSAVSARSFINAFSLNGVSYCVITAYLLHVAICAFVIAKLLKDRRENG